MCVFKCVSTLKCSFRSVIENWRSLMVSEYHWKSNDETPQQKCCHVEKSGRASLSSSNCSSLPSLYHEDNNMLKFKCLVEFWLKMLFRIFFFWDHQKTTQGVALLLNPGIKIELQTDDFNTLFIFTCVI